MHILALVIGALGAIAVVLFRVQQAANATREIADAASEVSGFFRRWQWSRKANANPLDLVDDPREAAAAMMVAVAQADGPLTESERRLMRELMMEKFGSSSRHADELIARGRWLTRDSHDAGNVLRRMWATILKCCNPAERDDLIRMLEAVNAADSRPDEATARDIERLRQSFKA